MSEDIINGSEIVPVGIDWLWFPYIPYGKVTLLQGDPGDGKSTFALNLAALMTRGEAFPFTDEKHEPMNVIYQNTEDDLDDTVIPRFINAGGEVDRIFFIDENKQPLTFDSVERIESAIRECEAKLIIFDPLVSYIGEDVSINQANEVRAKFNRLISIAKQTKCAILIVGHMNKMQGTKGIYRSVGSIDIVAAARSCLVISPCPEEPDNRIMAVQKNNLAKKGPAIKFEINEGKVEFLDTMEITADELLNAYPVSDGKRTDSKSELAKKVLVEMLSAGEKTQQEIMARMQSLNISRRTAENAKADIGIKSMKIGSAWYWKLP